MTAQQSQTYHNSCIVLPFQPARGRTFDGVGLALHFLLGNVMALHDGLKELWFGWRIRKIFLNSADLAAYCRGVPLQPVLQDLSQRENVRFWVHGHYDHCKVEIELFDACKTEVQLSGRLLLSLADHLVEFRRAFIHLIGRSGHPFTKSQRQIALWEECASLHGLDAIGRALETFYQYSAFPKDRLLDLAPFEHAVNQAPQSFIAHDLLGWARYRVQDYTSAKDAFNQALTINPDGAGAMSGLMWCSVHMRDWEQTIHWAVCKAETCGQNQTTAMNNARRRFDKLGA